MTEISAQLQELLDVPEVELIARLGQVRNDHPVAAEILRVLEYRRVREQSAAAAALMEATRLQAASGEALVKATKRLVDATATLARATTALAWMTALLVLAAAVQAWLLFKGHA
jgi:hypothetical protein